MYSVLVLITAADKRTVGRSGRTHHGSNRETRSQPEPARLDEFACELRRLLAPEGWLLLFSLNREPLAEAGERVPSRFRVVEEGRVVRERREGAPRTRRHYPTRRLESALAPLEIRKLHLQRDQLREFLAHKPRMKG